MTTKKKGKKQGDVLLQTRVSGELGKWAQARADNAEMTGAAWLRQLVRAERERLEGKK